jgi:hypothetical protein
MSKSKKKKAAAKLKKSEKKSRAIKSQTIQGDTDLSFPAKPDIADEVKDVDTHYYPYDENLLERARTQWQFGDWENLAALEREQLEHHPDRAKLALLVAAGLIQTGEVANARQFIRLAKDWGCGKKLISQILIAGVYNSLGRAAAVIGQEPRALKYFQRSVALGTPGNKARRLTQARVTQQIAQLDSPYAKLQFTLETYLPEDDGRRKLSPSQPATDVDSLINLRVTLPDGRQVQIPFNANVPAYIRREGDCLHFSVPEGKAFYLCSSHDGNFSNPPQSNQFALLPDTTYMIFGQIECLEHEPFIWVIEYDDQQRIAHATDKVKDNGFGIFFRTHERHVNLCLAIRLSAHGTLHTDQSNFHIRRQSNEDIQRQRHLEKILNQSMINSTRQLEAFVGVQNYLATGERMPDMHGWPISPDLALYLIDLLENTDYDIVVEFGSGTSTLLLARTLTRLASRRRGRPPVRLVAFEHLEHYYTQTSDLLQKAGMLDTVHLVLAPLETYTAPDGRSYPYYCCHDTLSDAANRQPVTDIQILVFVDGPPEPTGKHARYPALPAVLAHFKGAKIDILLDDYIREDEKEIVRLWLAEIEAQGLRYTLVEKKLEKDACLITIFGESAE